MNRRFIAPFLAVGTAGSLAGCGYSPDSRAPSGGAIGAGSEAIIGSATGMGPATGAPIGGGGIIGSTVTAANTVNPGRPRVGNQTACVTVGLINVHPKPCICEVD